MICGWVGSHIRSGVGHPSRVRLPRLRLQGRRLAQQGGLGRGERIDERADVSSEHRAPSTPALTARGDTHAISTHRPSSQRT